MTTDWQTQLAAILEGDRTDTATAKATADANAAEVSRAMSACNDQLLNHYYPEIDQHVKMLAAGEYGTSLTPAHERMTDATFVFWKQSDQHARLTVRFFCTAGQVTAIADFQQPPAVGVLETTSGSLASPPPAPKKQPPELQVVQFSDLHPYLNELIRRVLLRLRA